MDNTDKAEAPITDQDTLNEALAPVEEQQVETKQATEENKLLLGKYKSPEDLEKSYTHLQARATKAEQKLKELEAEAKKTKLEQLKSLDYDSQVQYLIERQQELEAQNEELRGVMSNATLEATAQSDAQAMESFISNTPELVETGMDELFRELAANPNYSKYTFESIYESRFKPKIEKLMGTKITVKNRPLKGKVDKLPEQPKRVSDMSMAEYEKERGKLLREAGIKGI